MVYVLVLSIIELVLLLTKYQTLNKWFRRRFLFNLSLIGLLSCSLVVALSMDNLSKSFRIGIIVGSIVWMFMIGHFALDKIKRSNVSETIENKFVLPEAYSNNPLCWDCNSPYKGKNIRITGIVNKIYEQKPKATDSLMHYIAEVGENITCIFETKEDMKSLCLNKTASIIGVCTENEEKLVVERCFIDLGK